MMAIFLRASARVALLCALFFPLAAFAATTAASPLLAIGLSPVLAQLELVLHVVGAWLIGHPTSDTALLLFFAMGLLNKMQGSPWGTSHPGFLGWVKRAVDLLGIFPHENAYGVLGGLLGKVLPPGVVTSLLQALFGWFNIPFLPSFEKEPDSREALQPRGYVSLRTAAAILLGASLILGVAGCAGIHKLFGPSIGQDEINCGEAAVKDFAKKMAPDAQLCLTSMGDWAGCLAKVEADAAVAGGEVALSGVVCGVAVLVRDFEEARSSAAVACASSNQGCAPPPDMRPLAAMRGRSYLAAHKKPVFPQ